MSGTPGRRAQWVLLTGLTMLGALALSFIEDGLATLRRMPPELARPALAGLFAGVSGSLALLLGGLSVQLWRRAAQARQRLGMRLLALLLALWVVGWIGLCWRLYVLFAA